MANTSNKNSSKNKIRHDIEKGAVLHYQFSNWEAFQLKQAWYRCSELIQMMEKSTMKLIQNIKLHLRSQTI